MQHDFFTILIIKVGLKNASFVPKSREFNQGSIFYPLYAFYGLVSIIPKTTKWHGNIWGGELLKKSRIISRSLWTSHHKNQWPGLDLKWISQ